jgi:hypothetical protein
MPRTLLWLACTLWLVASLPAAGGDGTKDVLARARGYVADYDRQLIAVIADERYLQAVTAASGEAFEGSRERVLDSEFAWISLPALGETIGVRDVLRVDGRTIADGVRLRTLLEHPRQDASREVLAILAESARHNIGDLFRNFNFPTFPLVYIRRGAESGLRWRADRAGRTVVLRFDEQERSTIVRTIDGRPTRGSGRFTVDRASGRVLACDIRLRLPDEPASRLQEYRIWVEFAHDERLDLWVPVRMIEQAGRAGGAALPDAGLRGEATYRNYRRYETTGRLLPR